MKKLIIPFIFSSLFLLSSGFVVSVQTDGIGVDRMQQDEFMNLDPFTAIHISVNADVHYTSGGSQKVSVEGDEEDIEDLIVEVKSGTLSIRYPGYGGRRSRLTIHITSKQLEEVVISGSASFNAKNDLQSEEMELMVSGSGEINFGTLSCDELEVKISGSGTITIEGGTADECDAVLSGSGKLLASGFEVNEFSTKVSGSGGCEITANNELEAIISGSGHVYYKGSPRVNSTISGSGKVKAL